MEPELRGRQLCESKTFRYLEGGAPWRSVPLDGFSSSFFTPEFAASSTLSAVTLPNSRNLKERRVRNRRRKSKSHASVTRIFSDGGNEDGPLENSPSHWSSSSVDELSSRTITQVCSPVSSLVVCRRYKGTYPARFQNLRNLDELLGGLFADRRLT